MIKVLHIVSALNGGGVENLLLNYYTHMDKDRFKFDFIVHGDNIGALESNFKRLNSAIYHIPSKHESFLKNLSAMKQIITDGNYDVVHVHQGTIGVFPMYYAKKAGVKVRINHSHIAYKEKTFFEKIIDILFLPFLKKYSTHWFACGLDAGRFLWGDKAVENGKVIVMNNAIDIDKFTFNADMRRRKRKELALDDKFVIGNVGRFTYQKNHEFLIKIFSEIHQKDNSAVLLLIGEGEFEEDVKEQVKNLGLSEAVKFLGIRNDVPELLQAMDVFLLPSRYEGLPVVLVETQAAALKSVASDTITKEVKVTNYLDYISLERDPEYWANEVLRYRDGYERYNTSEEIKNGGYDIRLEAGKLEQIYD